MEDLDYLRILSTLKELPFPVGKHTLSEILSGAVTKRIVTSNVYMELEGYGSLQGQPQARIEQWIDRLQATACITTASPPGQPHMRVLKITQKGLQELRAPTLGTLGSSSFQGSFRADEIDDASRALIQNFQFFLSSYNEEQQHAIASPAKRILCVAGAGTGKTTVLTRRIEFLVRYRGVDPRRILAITFTRKARAEMQSRLAGIGADVTTFNGFCEQLLRRNGMAKPLLTYGQKIRLFHDALAAENIALQELVFEYFTESQRKGATRDELERRLMGDVYSIIDHYANEDAEIPARGKSPLANTLLAVARTLRVEIEAKGLRDYSGQLRDALALLRNHPEAIPRYEHILVDEYQDVNVAQQRLLDLLGPEHLFVVGDPRQSIFGWRGSQIRYITEFTAEKTIQLRTNYRSRPRIVELMNLLIAGMQLPDLSSAHDDGGVVQTFRYASEEEELAGAATLLAHATQKDIFVLARTNRQLEDLSALLAHNGVAHSIKHEEDESVAEGIVLATVHAIKGLEAETVLVIGATSRYFPCKVSDHPVVDLIKDSSLDREDEERRLLYVAVSRARERLIITYTTTPTYFLDGTLGSEQANDERQRRSAARNAASRANHGSADRTAGTARAAAAISSASQGAQGIKSTPAGDAAFERLREWRAQIAKRHSVPAYCICSDRTLRELVELQPRSVAEMRGVYGLGDMKIRQYGAMLLEVLQR
jgi:superfamily I DNA/RNA helicase